MNLPTTMKEHHNSYSAKLLHARFAYGSGRVKPYAPEPTTPEVRTVALVERFEPPLSPDDLKQLTNEMNELMEDKKVFPPARADELRELEVKRCNKCSTVKPVADFHKSAGNRDGLAFQCKECSHTNTTAYREANRDSVLEQQREYNRHRYATSETHRMNKQLNEGYHRAVEAGNQAVRITPDELYEFWKLIGVNPLRCYITGTELTLQNRSIDHVVPISKGGSHTVANLMPTTKAANVMKRNQPAGEVVSAESQRDVSTTTETTTSTTEEESK